MGFNTQVFGSIGISPSLKPDHAMYLAAFMRSRHVHRHPSTDNEITNTPRDRPSVLYPGSKTSHKEALELKAIREAVHLPPGEDGIYMLENEPVDPSFVCHDKPFFDTEGVYYFCEWSISGDAISSRLEINSQGTKGRISEHIAWLHFLHRHFFKPWGYALNGALSYIGEDWKDLSAYDMYHGFGILSVCMLEDKSNGVSKFQTILLEHVADETLIRYMLGSSLSKGGCAEDIEDIMEFLQGRCVYFNAYEPVPPGHVQIPMTIGHVEWWFYPDLEFGYKATLNPKTTSHREVMPGGSIETSYTF